MDKIIKFLKSVYKDRKAVIAVSGGIDSAVSLTLLTKAIGAKNITALLLPYKDQSIEDAELICNINRVEFDVYNIEDVVDSFCFVIGIDDPVRKGNIMARTRMIVVYDYAKKLNALVCGTENKSEKHLAYFTRYGDEASDVEPIQHLYKTQVKELAKELDIPNKIINKAPSAGLWNKQTDEDELGFTYAEADLVMRAYIDKEDIQRFDDFPSLEICNKVINRIKSNHFKHEVPYTIE